MNSLVVIPQTCRLIIIIDNCQFKYLIICEHFNGFKDLPGKPILVQGMRHVSEGPIKKFPGSNLIPRALSSLKMAVGEGPGDKVAWGACPCPPPTPYKSSRLWDLHSLVSPMNLVL